MCKTIKALLFLLFCSGTINANNSKPTLYLIYSEYCGYSQELLNTTIANNNVQKLLKQDFNYHLLEAQSPEAQTIIKKFEITGVPVQVIKNGNDVLLSYGTISVEEELDFLIRTPKLNNLPTVAQDSMVAQTKRAFEDLVFRKTTLGYDSVKKEVLSPSDGNPYRLCRSEQEPRRYVCTGGGGAPSNNFLEKGEKNGDFRVSVFHPSEKELDGLSVSVNSVVENGKVVKQSHCRYDSDHRGDFEDETFHYSVAKFKCLVATSKMCKFIRELKSEENRNNESKYSEFKDYLYGDYFKEVKESYGYNFEKVFLNINIERNYKYYSKLAKRKYPRDEDGDLKEDKITSFADFIGVKKSKTFLQMVKSLTNNEYKLLERFIAVPCSRLEQGNILADTDF